MNKTEIIEVSAKSIAKMLHFGQVDKGGHDYFAGHLTRVAKAVRHLGKDYEDTAWLHDVLEDTECYPAFLRRLDINETVLEAIVTLTKDKNISYNEYIEKVKKNEIARAVKIADIQDNMKLCRLAVITSKDLQRNKKYENALKILQG